MFTDEHSWIRCNKCSASFSERELFITICEHIFCINCINKDVNTNNVFCPECTIETPITKVDSKLIEEKTIYFSDLSKFRELINDAKKFQTYHMKKNFNVLYLKYKKATEMMEEFETREKKWNKKIAKLHLMEKKLGKELKRKDDEIERLKRTIQEYKKAILELKKSNNILEEKIKKLKRDEKNNQKMMSSSLVCNEKDKDMTNKLSSTNSQIDPIPFRSSDEDELEENNLSVRRVTEPEEFS